MGFPSNTASNAVIYVTYALFLLMGTGIAWKMRHQSKADFLSGNGTQTGQKIPSCEVSNNTEHRLITGTAFPLALNFIASALGSGILFSYPELATISGVQGMIVYALASSLPMLIFGYLGPIIRRRCPEGFVLTEWTRQRYGVITMLYLSFMSLVTLFLYMVGELSAIGQVVNAMTGLKPLPVMIVQCAVTTIYTSLGGFRISFITDVAQGTMVIGLVIIAAITIGAKTEIQRPLIEESGLTKSNLLGWQLLYILPVAVLTNDFFLSSFWLRTFASKTDKDLRIGTTIATIVILCILTLVGSTGLIAVWSGALSLEDAAGSGSVAFFVLLETLPSWVVGIVLVMVVTMSTAAFDSLQSAMVSSGSNDLFRNKLNIWYIRAFVVVIIIPVIVIALKAPSVLQIWLITDLISAATIPVLVIGLVDKFYWWRGFEVVVGGLGGILTVFIFGCIYYGNAQEAGELLLVQKGLYGNDWSAFGAFVAAPVGSILWGCGALALRLSYQYMSAKIRGHRFDALDRPVDLRPSSTEEDVPTENLVSSTPGKFF
ncbi:uncharacterized protein FFB20_06058 [Fusarium fujikuroi]|uniref:Uncharacterized protein n=1 Tax=Fusarium fujikuroi TaxID=5127 RepID=A0A2H3RI83_FUSFU|nr:uncharacterized protein LW94_8191 [Fusarium fujikuroi]KLP00956.1 uncharacterized protein Y057_14779 [Fusarium fujikuroi]QGI65614.1 hypothetical protein CEK27_009585 [Fusarium fujikuroi]SCN80052.1 uncharacterized protein FFB20_06058 [Fusarium fujikuroi]SCN83341.1 uncharacterized protein FFC1_04192 [Fusarium fujikuroi]